MNDIDWSMVFDGWAPVVRTLILGTLSYFSLIVLLRVSGKRTLSKMNAFDLVVTVAFGSTLASILTSKNVALVQGVTAMALLVVLQLICTYLAVRIRWFHRLIKAQPTLIFYRGQYLDTALKQQRVTEAEVLAAMREKGIANPNDVDAVVIESEGSLSILKKNAASREDLARAGVEVERGELEERSC